MLDIATQLALETVINQYAQKRANDAFLLDPSMVCMSGLHRLPSATSEQAWKWFSKPNVGNTIPGQVVPHGKDTWTPGDPTKWSATAVSTNEDNFYNFMPVTVPKVLPIRIVDRRVFQ